MTGLPGISGLLFPAQFLAERAAPPDPRAQASLLNWWSGVARACGPATGARAVFDLVAMPLCARLGFRARDLAPARDGLTARLLTPRGQAVGLHVLGWRGWAARPPALWRDAVATARSRGADWCLALAPPHLSLVPARGHASRRTLDFTFPDILETDSLSLLMALAHASAFEAGGRTPGRLDAWLADATQYHARLHTSLRAGVVEALGALTGVLQPRAAPAAAFDEALTLVYRILFLLFAESRALVPVHHPIYREAYTLGSLCDDAMRGGTPGGWDALAAITSLSRTGGRVDSLQVFPFNGHLFSRRAAPSLEAARRPTRPTPRSRARDRALTACLLALGTRVSPEGRLRLHYGDLGVEQLGAVYERVLDLDADTVTGTTAPIRRPSGHSAVRKDSGTFYTPLSIADLTVRRTLGPLVRGASADRILDLRIVDPAMGSGAFLIAALQYLAQAYERALVAEGRHAPLEINDGLRAEFKRLIAQRCLYGVDVNPVAVQVARLSLWLATLAQGRPLGFLDHRLRVGNSLIGATPDALKRPPGARERDLPLFDGAAEDLQHSLRGLTTPLFAMASTPDASVDVVRDKERQWTHLVGAQGPAARWRLAMHLWCARWWWPRGARPPARAELTAAVASIVQGRNLIGGAHLARWTATADAVARELRCFHWPIEFPDVCSDADGRPGAGAGFDAVIGNPPWEMIRRDARSNRQGSGRDPLVAFIRESGLYPRCRTGHVNLYQPFIDRALQLVNTRGRIGLVLPWGFATDDGAADLRKAIIGRDGLDTIVGFDNARGLFPVHRSLRFAIIVTRPSRAGLTGPRPVRARFGVMTTEEADGIPEPGETGEDGALPIRIEHGTLTALGGPGLRLLDLRTGRDVDWARSLRRHPPIGEQKGWGLTFGRELNATDDRHLLRSRTRGGRGLPVIEGKHIAPFRCDVGTTAVVLPAEEAERRWPDRRFARPRLAYRDVSGVGNARALVAAIIPAHIVTTHTLFCLRTDIPVEQQHYLCGVFNSDVIDRLVRLEMGGHLTTSLVEHLPVPPWTGTPIQREIAALAASLRDASTPAAQDRINALVRCIFGLK